MARYAYERLSAQDASFLWAETAHEPMHVGAVAVFESGPLRNEDHGIDVARYRSAVESVLHWIPRYRQKLVWTPFEGWPVWVDDRHFDLGYHIRHLSLPRPGTLAQLKELAARILSRHLDRSRALWEIWVIEGLEGGEQFALINKVHHCMIDGAAGADLSQILFSPSPTADVPDPVPYMPRPEPRPLELIADSVRKRSSMPLEAVRRVGRMMRSDPAELAGELQRRGRAVGELVRFGLEPASPTPLNGDLSPHRRFEWFTMPLQDLLDVRRVLGCTVNDVVLATVTGAMRRYLFRRRVDAASLDFRVAAPVSTRREEHDRRQGNHVSTWIVRLPLAEEDPLAQIDAIKARTEELKRSEASLGVETIMNVAEWLPPAVIARGASIARGPANMLVTNVPGPQFPLYEVGARLLGMYPVVPLIPGTGLGVALFSYEGKLCWGFNADYELLPDLASLVDDVRIAFEELRAKTVTRYMARRTGKPESPRGKKPARKSTGRKASATSRKEVSGARSTATKGISSARKKPAPDARSTATNGSEPAGGLH
jgi:WS/DGAT/MGAT family acyltransferase